MAQLEIGHDGADMLEKDPVLSHEHPIFMVELGDWKMVRFWRSEERKVDRCKRKGTTKISILNSSFCFSIVVGVTEQKVGVMGEKVGVIGEKGGWPAENE